MCGIVGIAGEFSAEDISRALGTMNDAIAHRGPDDSGLWAEDGFGFAMRRLSIIDLQTGSQPMWDEARGLGLVYNGETYNYRELRDDLKGRGETFVTTSDTEIVLKTLALHGEAGLSRLNGMYGAALWDANNHGLLLFRDRLGIKPLYYHWDGNTFIFASEIKAILASGLIEARVNQQAVWDYLTLRYVPEPETVWQNVYKLPPGNLLRWSASSPAPEVRPYWELEGSVPMADTDPETALKEFETLFLDAVEKRLISADVPVGVLLSGGLDSSAVAAAAVELGHKDFHTFSVGFKDGGRYSELPYAREMAAHIGARHHEVIIGQDDFLRLLPEMVHAADEPLADLASIPLLAVSRLAREHVKVVLSGEGSDEVLGGYNFDARIGKWDTIRRLQALPPILSVPLAFVAGITPGGKSKALRRALTIPLKKWNLHFPPHMTGHWSEEEKKTLWRSFEGNDTLRIIRALYKRSGRETPLDQMLYAYQRDWMVEDLLMKADKMTMYASLELRVPFLDYRLVEWAARQPQQVKIGPAAGKKRTTKAVLRRFAEKRLPKSVIERPKQGFPVPAYDWLGQKNFQDQVHEWARRTSAPPLSFAETSVETAFAQAGGGDIRAAHNAWVVGMLGAWLDCYGKYAKGVVTL